MTQQNNTGVGNTPDWVTMSDPNEGAFSVQMPGGWQNQAALIRIHDQIRNRVVSQSQDGGTFLFMGDPELPSFIEPGGMPATNPMTQVHPFVPADAFFQQYVQQRYGKMPGFAITSVGPSPTFERFAQEGARKHGMQTWVTTVRICFDYVDRGTTMHAILHGTSLSFGQFWMPDVAGILTRGNPTRFEEMLFWMASSYQTNPQWRQNSDNRHAQRMAEIQTNHQSAMSAMQTGHQGRMNAIQQAGAANTQMFNDRMAQIDVNHQAFMNTIHQPTASPYQSDSSHERFLNYIKDENTVVDQSGQSYQVTTGQDRYYVNKSDNTYIGTDSTVEREDLRSRFGVNPDNYEETKIKR